MITLTYSLRAYMAFVYLLYPDEFTELYDCGRCELDA